MNDGKTACCSLLWLTFLHVVGLGLFGAGFFLTRTEVPAISECAKPPIISSGSHDLQENKSCWMESRFDKAVIILIDALRFDFVMFNDTLESKKYKSEKQFYHNHLRVIHQHLQESPKHSKLFRFLADAPTVTMQRLKGLTTGGLPTFIDFKDNFNQEETITEDNVISQLTANNKSVVFMGDDTWMSLYSKEFLRTFPAPSFDVSDLNTVDNMCNEHVFDEIQKLDWDLLIAHYLGVDHVGHTFEPNHSQMKRKLRQMNHVLADILKQIEQMESTILFVFGDHGMTPDGNHGGASEDEVDAALFIYSSDPIFDPDIRIPSRSSSDFGTDLHKFPVVAQTDLVPSLSLLMGLPIPFSNIGSVIPELFLTSLSESAIEEHFGGDRIQAELSQLDRFNEALRINSMQVLNYLTAYSQQPSTKGEFNINELASQLDECLLLHEQLHGSNEKIKIRIQQSRHLSQLYQTFLSDARKLCEDKWATFDYPLMGFGIFVLVCTCFINCVMIYLDSIGEGIASFKSLQAMFLGSFCGLITASAVGNYHRFWLVPLKYAIPGAVIGAVLIQVMYLGCISRILSRLASLKQTLQAIDVDTWVVLVVLVVYLQGLFTNSFIVAEQSVIMYLLQSLAVSFIFRLLRNPPYGNVRWVVGLGICVRTMWSLTITRQGDPTTFEVSIAVILGSFLLCIFLRYLYTVGSLGQGLVPALLTSVSVIAALIHWFAREVRPISTGSAGDDIYISQILIARGSYVFALMAFLFVIVNSPTTVYKEETGRPNSQSVPELYKYLKEQKGKKIKMSGVRANHLSLLVILFSIFIGPIFILQGHQFASLLMPIVGLLYCFCKMDEGNYVISDSTSNAETSPPKHTSKSRGRNRRKNNNDTVITPLEIIIQPSRISCGEVLFLWMLGIHLFFATGHGNQLNTVDYSSSFHGFPNFNFWLHGSLSLLNTFCGYLLVAIMLPLLLAGRLYFLPRKDRTNVFRETEIMYSNMFYSNVCKAFAILMFFSSLRITISSINAFIQRRHLMVFEIFAPKWIFDSASCLVLDLCVLGVFCFILYFTVTFESLLHTKRE